MTTKMYPWVPGKSVHGSEADMRLCLPQMQMPYVLSLHSEKFLHFLCPQILKLFYPTLSAHDTFNAGQFFAVMRLVTHARDGKAISKTLAFTQGTTIATVATQHLGPG